MKEQKETRLRAAAHEDCDGGKCTTTAGQQDRPMVEAATQIKGHRERLFSHSGLVARMNSGDPCARSLRCRSLQLWRWRRAQWKKWPGLHLKRVKLHRWEEPIASCFGKDVGDGYAVEVKELEGWLDLTQNRQLWRTSIRNGGDVQQT